MTSTVDEHRTLLPFSSFISSTGSQGSTMVTDIYILPDKLDDYIQLVSPVVRKMRAMPECLWCEISQNPTDAGNIRIHHGWTKDTAWFTQVSVCVFGGKVMEPSFATKTTK
jgi:hypothetical protein